MKRALLTFGALIFESLLLFTDINAESRREVIVSAAMSLKNAFEEIGKVFEKKQKGVKIVFNFGPSGGLQRQIEAGAPVDVEHNVYMVCCGACILCCSTSLDD